MSANYVNEEEILAEAREIAAARQHQKLRNFIWNNHVKCRTDEVKLQLLRLWEESVYAEFLESRIGQPGANGADLTAAALDPNNKEALSSSMRYKLRKKHPCPIELEQELRVKNARLPKPVHDGLNGWLKTHRENPYPNKREKEALAAKLGITPQQVNRWFIQRRKMIRIRGQNYIGRFDTPGESGQNGDGGSDHGYDYDAEDMDMDDDGHIHNNATGLSTPTSYVEYRNMLPTQPQQTTVDHTAIQVAAQQAVAAAQAQALAGGANPSANVSLLEKILLKQQQEQQAKVAQTNLHSGAVVTEVSVSSSSTSQHHQPQSNGGKWPLLTPPPSVSDGDSNARSTPDGVNSLTGEESPSAVEQREALDLSAAVTRVPKSSPVILEPLTPEHWSQNRQQVPKFVVKTEIKSEPLVESPAPLDDEEMNAVRALLSLSKAF